ncbi:MAG TPA: hypothetical protein VF131_11010 [Blastocatellia bacterium]|nr:hypothetical protein [Blastocatellia bacterium]
MPREITQLKVFVSCPGDVEKEKQLVHILCNEINQGFQDRCNVSLMMVEWRESVVPQFGPRPQQIINEQIGEYDVFIGILWKRFGTPPGATNPHTGQDYDSGTEEEFETAYDRWKQHGDPLINFYFKQDANSIPSFSEMESLQKVLRFKEKLKREYRGWVIDFEGELDFERKLRRFLQKVCFDISDRIGKKKPELLFLSSVEKEPYERVQGYIRRKVCAVLDYNSATSVYLLRDKAQDLIDLLESHKRLVLLSDAGAGKTTELKRLAAYYSSQDSSFYPYLISLNKYVNQSISELLPTSWAQVREEQLLIILDGLDEIESKNKNDAIRQIELFSENHPACHIVVSCRANFYNTELKQLTGTLSGFSSFVLLDLDTADIKPYVEAKLGTQVEKFYSIINSQNLHSLLGIPFYLVRLVERFSEDLQLPQTKAQLFEELLDARFELDEVHYRTTIELEEKRRDITDNLEQIALIMESLGRNYISDSEYRTIIPEEAVRELLKYCTAWKREKEEPAQWQFEHNNFQEYLAARALSKQPLQVIKSFISFAPEYTKIIPTWTNTLSFLVSLLSKDNALFNELIGWVLTIEPELTVKFEVGRLDDDTRIHIFTRIFEEYKEKKIWIDRHKYEYRELARFGQSHEACEFLLSEAENPTHYTTLANAIELLRHSVVPSSQKPRVTKLLMNQALNEGHEYIQNVALLAMADLGLNSQETVKQIIPMLRSSQSDWVRYGLYYFLYNSDFLDENIDVFIEGIKYAGRMTVSYGSEIGKSRLADEPWHLSQGMQRVSSPEAIIRILTYFEANPEDLSNVYLNRIFPTIIKRATDSYPTYPSMFDSVLNLVIALLKEGNEKEASLLSPFFDATHTRMRAFQQVFSRSKNNEDITRILAFIADRDCLEFYVQQYEKRNITNDDVWRFQYNLGLLNNILSLPFNDLINEKSGNQFMFAPTRNIDEERKVQREHNINLLFNKSAFINEVKQVFDREEKESFTKDDLINIQIKNRGGEHDSNLAFRTLYKMAEGGAISENEAVRRLDENWEWFSISNIYEYLSNDAELNLSPYQIEWIKDWCRDHLSEVNYKTALVTDGKGESSTSQLAVWLWYFLRRFNLNFPKRILLDLLSFDWVEGHQMGGIGYLEEVLSENEITERILENLKDGIKHDDVLKNHISYCKRHSIKDVIPYALNTIRDKNKSVWVRELALETVEELSDDLSNLEFLLPEITDGFRWTLVRRLIQRESNVCIPYLRDILESGDEQERLKAAVHLIELQDLEGLKFYADLVEREKKYIASSYDKSPLKPLRIIDSVPLLIKLLKISYQADFERAEFYTLDQAVLNSLETVALQSDEAYQRVRHTVLDFINTMSKEVERATFLHYFLDNLERSYYTRKSQNISLIEAISKVKTLI